MITTKNIKVKQLLEVVSVNTKIIFRSHTAKYENNYKLCSECIENGTFSDRDILSIIVSDYGKLIIFINAE